MAFSGAQEFIERYKDATNIIGHFGLGFYSAFMVADRVDIFTKSHHADAPAVHWTSDGGTEYEMETTDKAERGTDIVLHLSEEAKEYLETYRVEQLLTKYCRFLPVPIQFGEEEVEVANEVIATDEMGPV